MTEAPKLTKFAKATLKDRYLQDGEDCKSMFFRIVQHFEGHELQEYKNRMLKYMNNLWFIPSTPILSNGGTEKGLPISCFLNNVDDTLESIDNVFSENMWIGSNGGGIGTCWSDVRGAGASVGGSIKGVCGSSGVVPFIKMQDSQTLAISQGSLRRGSAAAYIDISHPEIREFLDIRKTSGDANRRCPNMHHGILISDAFMAAMLEDDVWNLICPKTRKITDTISARCLFEDILETRISTGEPYIVFIDAVNRNRNIFQKKMGFTIKQSNLCSEIMLVTNSERTAVCCLGSVNLELYDDWCKDDLFIKDCMMFLDNVLEDFIYNAKDKPGFKKAVYSAERERNIGLGAMGLHSLFQKKGFAFGDKESVALNKLIFSQLRERTKRANLELGNERRRCEDMLFEYCGDQRFMYTTAIAPTASISIIAGTSPSIEPWNSNVFTQKTLSGTFTVKNKYLMRLLKELHMNTYDTMSSIMENGGSVQHLDFLSDKQKAVFRTAFEIDQMDIVNMAGDRAKYIDQSQSVNLFMEADCEKQYLFDCHVTAWKRDVKSLYYLRSRSVGRPSFVKKAKEEECSVSNKYEECEACQ